MAAQIPQNDFLPRQTAKINIYFDSWLFIRWDFCIISPPILILSYRCKKIQEILFISSSEVMFWSFWLVCTSISRLVYKVMNGFTCIKLLLEVYFGPRNNLINFGDAPDYDPDPRSGLRSALHGGSLQSLTDCPVIYVIGVQLSFCYKISNWWFDF